VTHRIAGAVDLFRDVAGMPTDEIAGRVRDDHVDILVILAGHAGANPLAVAGRRPAPVQVSFHDVSTSGVEAVDAWLTDQVLHPEDTPERFVERLVRLPCFYLHRPPEEAPTSASRPEGAIVFGCFNNPLKLGAGVLAVWRRVLDAVPGSRLLLKYKNRFASRLVQAPIRHRLGDRVEFLGGDVGRAEQLALWNRVDIALDPFPFNGSTTSFEALWMGVPVVTLAGDRFVGRVGASLLAQVGLDDLVADDVDGYVAAAAALAVDRARLVDLRAGLRDRVRGSPLCDPEAYARAVEAAYLDLWRSRCSRA
jgi:predicted O-linked N-acetylglucosamine transferase (SPINDLY family)